MKRFEQYTLGEFLDAVGSKSPTPGGGAVASAVGALGTALGKMVVAYSLGKKSLAEHQVALESAAAALGRARLILMELAEEDAAAYGVVNELMKLPPEDARRRRDWDDAVRLAVGVPRAAVGACCDLLRLLETLVPITNRHLRSDLAIAAVLAEAGARSAWWNVDVNLPQLADLAERGNIRSQLLAMLEEARERTRKIERLCAE